MQLHQLQPQTLWRRGQRIGRGGKRGTTAGRGTKGQKARAGHKIRPAMLDIVKKLPKLRGYRFKSFRQKPAIVNLGNLEKHFQEGDVITPEALVKKGLIRKIKGRTPSVKILGGGDTKKTFRAKGVLLSERAKEKISAAPETKMAPQREPGRAGAESRSKRGE